VEARRRGGGHVSEAGSGAPRGDVASDGGRLGQHGAAGDGTREGEKQIELHGVL